MLTHHGTHGTDVRPARKGTAETGRKPWAKDPSAAGARDGTVIDATFLNDIKGLIVALCEHYSIPLTEGDDSLLADAIDAAIAAGLDSLETSDIDGLVAALALKAPLASPGLTGAPTAPTAAGATNNTQIATTAFVRGEIDSLIASAPGLLNTLDELAAAIGDDPSFAATMATALAAKAPLASPGLTGTPTAPTAAPGTNTTQLGTTAFVTAAVAAAVTALIGGATAACDTFVEVEALIAGLTSTKAPLASPVFTGNPEAPTQTAGNSSTRLATTAFVGTAITNASASAPLPPGFNSVRYAQAADTDHDITFDKGKARDSTDLHNLIATAAMTKQIDAAWAAGNNAGGMDTSSVGNSLIYYMHMLGKSGDAAAYDFLFSLSRTAPTLPGSGWDLFQCIGFVFTDGSANILAFKQMQRSDPNEITFVAPILAISAASQTTTRTLRTIACAPPLSTVYGRFFTASDGQAASIYPSYMADSAPSGTSHPRWVADFAGSRINDGNGMVDVDASSQVYCDGSNTGNITLAVHRVKFLAPIIP